LVETELGMTAVNDVGRPPVTQFATSFGAARSWAQRTCEFWMAERTIDALVDEMHAQ
jgi:hypothetical protein